MTYAEAAGESPFKEINIAEVRGCFRGDMVIYEDLNYVLASGLKNKVGGS